MSRRVSTPGRRVLEPRGASRAGHEQRRFAPDEGQAASGAAVRKAAPVPPVRPRPQVDRRVRPRRHQAAVAGPGDLGNRRARGVLRAQRKQPRQRPAVECDEPRREHSLGSDEKARAVGRQRERARGLAQLEAQALLAARRAPDAHAAVRARGDDRGGVGCERYSADGAAMAQADGPQASKRVSRERVAEGIGARTPREQALPPGAPGGRAVAGQGRRVGPSSRALRGLARPTSAYEQNAHRRGREYREGKGGEPKIAPPAARPLRLPCEALQLLPHLGSGERPLAPVGLEQPGEQAREAGRDRDVRLEGRVAGRPCRARRAPSPRARTRAWRRARRGRSLEPLGPRTARSACSRGSRRSSGRSGAASRAAGDRGRRRSRRGRRARPA